MTNLTLHYCFGDDDFDYEVGVDLGCYLSEYLEDNYSSVEEAVEDLYEGADPDEKKEVLECKTLEDLASLINERDPEWGEEIVSSSDGFVESIEDELKDEYEDEASDAYDDANDGCDPDGFYGWGDYWRWKNG